MSRPDLATLSDSTYHVEAERTYPSMVREFRSSPDVEGSSMKTRAAIEAGLWVRSWCYIFTHGPNPLRGKGLSVVSAQSSTDSVDKRPGRESTRPSLTWAPRSMQRRAHHRVMFRAIKVENSVSALTRAPAPPAQCRSGLKSKTRTRSSTDSRAS